MNKNQKRASIALGCLAVGTLLCGVRQEFIKGHDQTHGKEAASPLAAQATNTAPKKASGGNPYGTNLYLAALGISGANFNGKIINTVPGKFYGIFWFPSLTNTNFFNNPLTYLGCNYASNTSMPFAVPMSGKPGYLTAYSLDDYAGPQPCINGITNGQSVTEPTKVTLNSLGDLFYPYLSEAYVQDTNGYTQDLGTVSTSTASFWVIPMTMARGAARLQIISTTTKGVNVGDPDGNLEYPQGIVSVGFVNNSPITVENYSPVGVAGNPVTFNMTAVGSYANASMTLLVLDQHRNTLNKVPFTFSGGFGSATWDGTSNGYPYSAMGRAVYFDLTTTSGAAQPQTSSTNPPEVAMAFGGGRRSGRPIHVLQNSTNQTVSNAAKGFFNGQ